MSLYLKYRPTEFEEFVANEELKESIEGFISREPEDIPRAWLFEGPSGCGKTTLARLVADKLGIEPANLAEYDVADMRGIDFIRDLRRKMNLSAMGGGYRGYILDECHQLTKDAQNALLKATEDTPKHVFFFMCTTDPNKIIKTLINRPTRFTVSALNPKEMSRLIKDICEQEDKDPPSKDIIKLIHLESMGSPRAALVMLDKIIDMDEDKHQALIEKAAEEEEEAIALCRALIARKPWKKVSKILEGIRTQDAEGVRRMIMAYAANVLISKGDANSFLILSIFKEPFYNSGFPGLVEACYDVLEG
jgi:DNA polymerase III subunit gamma/tau